MAETSSLLNCRTGYRTGGSNPPASASFKQTIITAWRFHLTVRIQDSQSWHTGSIPVGATKRRPHSRSFFCSAYGNEPAITGPILLVCYANALLSVAWRPSGTALVRILTSPQYVCACAALRQSVPHLPTFERILVRDGVGHMFISKGCPTLIYPISIFGADKRGTHWRY